MFDVSKHRSWNSRHNRSALHVLCWRVCMLPVFWCSWCCVLSSISLSLPQCLDASWLSRVRSTRKASIWRRIPQKNQPFWQIFVQLPSSGRICNGWALLEPSYCLSCIRLPKTPIQNIFTMKVANAIFAETLGIFNIWRGSSPKAEVVHRTPAAKT
jgi:hypothetical protein